MAWDAMSITAAVGGAAGILAAIGGIADKILTWRATAKKDTIEAQKAADDRADKAYAVVLGEKKEMLDQQKEMVDRLRLEVATVKKDSLESDARHRECEEKYDALRKDVDTVWLHQMRQAKTEAVAQKVAVRDNAEEQKRDGK